jgi:hypothetical protein
VDEGSTGFLGIGARDARIAVWGGAAASEEITTEDISDEV